MRAMSSTRTRVRSSTFRWTTRWLRSTSTRRNNMLLCRHIFCRRVNSCKARYFMTHLTSLQTEFVESVLSLKPLVATFDCDGTLWSGDAGEGFFSWELKEGLVSEEITRWAR